eukprot:4612218-Prymnesium_polylepis.1
MLRDALHSAPHSGCAHARGGDAGGNVARDERGTRLRGPATPSSNPVHITGRGPLKPTPPPAPLSGGGWILA